MTPNYFDELIERVCRIRTSERNFYEKVLDSFATGIDHVSRPITQGSFMQRCKINFIGTMRKIRWGILSTARIGTQKVIPAMRQGKHCDIIAMASRNLVAAKQAAAQLGIPKVYDSYEELLNDPEDEAIYNPLPNHLHVPWSIKAIEAGKHVLVEKPIATSVNQLQQLLNVAKAHSHIKVMEAFMYRLHPQWLKARELAQSGKI